MTISPEALEQAGRLPWSVQGRIRRLILRLEKWPAVSGAKSLSGNLAGHYRLRAGDYRVQFRVAGENVIIERSG